MQEPLPTQPKTPSQPTAWEMDLLWEKYKRFFFVAVIALGILATGITFFFVRESHIRQGSQALLSRASSIEQLQTIISKYPSSNAAASALLLLAAEQRRLGNLVESDATYKQFLKNFPNHSLVSGASLGIAENILISSPRLEDGLSALQSLSAQYPQSYTAPFALYTQASLLATHPGQASEAKRQLRNLNQQFPDSIAAQYSANLLALLGARN